MKKNESIKDQQNENETNERREFLEKFGKLAATAPVGMLMLMGPSQSRANSSGSNDTGGT